MRLCELIEHMHMTILDIRPTYQLCLVSGPGNVTRSSKIKCMCVCVCVGPQSACTELWQCHCFQ